MRIPKTTWATRRLAVTGAVAGIACLQMAACSSEEAIPDATRIGRDASALRIRAECVDDITTVPQGAWICPEPRTIECGQIVGEDPIETLFVSPSTGTCADVDALVGAGPYGVGEHEIVVTNGASGVGTPSTDAGGDSVDGGSSDAGAGHGELCTTTLTVIDTSPPQPASTDVVLWPPNHSMHTIGVDDCVTLSDSCDPDIDVHFLWVSSDEPATVRPHGRGHGGHHDADIAALDCESVELRSERAGNGNGRVYLIGWRAVDDAGNATDGVCRVTVPHDHTSEAVEDAAAMRVDAPEYCELAVTPPSDGTSGDSGVAPPAAGGAGGTSGVSTGDAGEGEPDPTMDSDGGSPGSGVANAFDAAPEG